MMWPIDDYTRANVLGRLKEIRREVSTLIGKLDGKREYAHPLDEADFPRALDAVRFQEETIRGILDVPATPFEKPRPAELIVMSIPSREDDLFSETTWYVYDRANRKEVAGPFPTSAAAAAEKRRLQGKE